MHMRKLAIMTVALAFGLSALEAPLASRPAQQDGDWQELVLGVAHVPWERSGMDDPEVLVGELPDGFRQRVYLPADASVHGSLVRTGGNLTVVATTDLSADDLWAEYESEMQNLGWRLPDERSGLTRSLADVALAWVFCGEGIEAALVTVTESQGKSRLRIDRHTEYRTPHCTAGANLAREPSPASERPQRRPPGIPGPFRLRPPPTEAAALGACADYSRMRSSHAAIASTMGREGLQTHYEAQLEAGGWLRTNEQEAAVIVSSWERDDTHAVMLLMPIDDAPGCWHFAFEQKDRIGARPAHELRSP